MRGLAVKLTPKGSITWLLEFRFRGGPVNCTMASRELLQHPGHARPQPMPTRFATSVATSEKLPTEKAVSVDTPEVLPPSVTNRTPVEPEVTDPTMF